MGFALARGLAQAGAAIVLGYGVHQHALAERARQLTEPARVLQGIEPIGWTRLYALRWAAIEVASAASAAVFASGSERFRCTAIP